MALKIPKRRKKLVPTGIRAQAPPGPPVKNRAVKKKASAKKVGQLITKAQAIAEFGEEGGPMLFRLINSSEKKPPASPATRLRDSLDAWASKEGLAVRYVAFAPGIPGAGELERTLDQVSKDLQENRWVTLAFRPGARPPVQFPAASEFPAKNCDWHELYSFAKRFNPHRYWGHDFDLSHFEATTRAQWRNAQKLPARLDELLSALFHFASYAWQVGGVAPAEEAYLRALLEAARDRTERRGHSQD